MFLSIVKFKRLVFNKLLLFRLIDHPEIFVDFFDKLVNSDLLGQHLKNSLTCISLLQLLGDLRIASQLFLSLVFERRDNFDGNSCQLFTKSFFVDILQGVVLDDFEKSS